MKKWYHEDWHFKIEAFKVGKENNHQECRIGIEPGDMFECAYETPAGFCPTSFIKIFSTMEAVRCQGDLRNLGGKGVAEIEFLCPDGVVMFRLKGMRSTPS